jgi:hypothetical protein
MKLPNPHKAIIDPNKLVGYSLNINHADGQHKARVFKSALNITTDDVDILNTALLNAVQNNEAITDKSNSYGQKYIIDFPLTRDNKTAIIHSVWIVKYNENFPRLITCYVL